MGGMFVTLQALSSSTVLDPRLLPPVPVMSFPCYAGGGGDPVPTLWAFHSAAAFTTINVTKRPRCFHSSSVYSILTWKWTLWKFWVCEEPRRYFHLKCHGSNNTLCLKFAVHLVTLNCFAAAAEWEAEVVAAVPKDLWGSEQECTGGFYEGPSERECNEKVHKCTVLSPAWRKRLTSITVGHISSNSPLQSVCAITGNTNSTTPPF